MWLGKKQARMRFWLRQIWSKTSDLEPIKQQGGRMRTAIPQTCWKPREDTISKPAGCEHGCVEDGWWAKTLVRGMLAEQEVSRGRGLGWDRGSLQLNTSPGTAGGGFHARKGDRLAWEALLCKKKIIPVRTWMCWILGIEFKPFPALLSFDTMLTMAFFNRYFRGNFTQHPRDFIKVNMTNCETFPEECLTTGLHQFC